MLALILFSANASARAGMALFVKGEVNAEDSKGVSRLLKRGGDIFQDDTIDTGKGRLQIRFTDGGKVSLQPGTVFRVEEYNFEGKTDGLEKGFFRLVKGGLRAITGAIGGTNKETYKIETPVATIGIRGTSFAVVYCPDTCTYYGRTLAPGLYVRTSDGMIFVANPAGTVDVPIGQAVYVRDLQTPPRLTDTPPLLPVARHQPLEIPSGFQVGEQVDESGTPIFFTGANRSLAVVHAAGLIGIDFPDTYAEYDSNGNLIALKSDGPGPTFDKGSASLAESGSDATADVHWGRWTPGFSATDGSGNDLTVDSLAHYHFISGLTTSPDIFDTLAGTIGTYNLVGGTLPTDSGGTAANSLDSGQITVDFSS